MGLLVRSNINLRRNRFRNLYDVIGAKVDWGFRISDLVKNPDGTDI